jgi:large subunit ribosomal protein L1
MGSKKNVDMTQTESDVKIIKAAKVAKTDKKAKKEDKATKKTEKKASTDEKEVAEKKETVDKKEATKEEVKAEKKPSAEKKSKKVRSKKYQAVRAQLDKTKAYDPAQAIALVKKFSYAKFDASVETHIVVKEVGTSVNLTLPHSTGKSINVVIANDEVLAEVEKGNINFDVLLASPELMPKLAKLAKILGPKGLMPNPKNGTLTPKPELKKKELEAGTFTLKTEKKAPLMHLVIGKVSMDDKVLEENLLTIIRALKNKIVKIVIAPSMGPAIRVDYELEEAK